MKIKPLIYGAFVLAITFGFIASINAKEKQLKSGSEFYLELAPVDPRSLMQGDYMILNYKTNNTAAFKNTKTGKVIMKKDGWGVASVKEPYNGQNIGQNEFILKFYKTKSSRGGRIAPESFFFQEGQAHKYAQAKYALLKHDGKGSVLLISLADKDLNTI